QTCALPISPSSVTKTSPCWNGFIVPGSTLRYGSSFCMVTRRPRRVRRRPRLDAVSPFPRLEATPPVTKRCLVGRALPVAAEGKEGAPVVVARADHALSTGHQDNSR